MVFCRSTPLNRQKAVSCPSFEEYGSIPILRPEIVIEERRWIPYPMVIRHYIEKPKCHKPNKILTWYKNQKEECRIRAEQKREAKRLEEARERAERERCLRELRRLHSHHQSLCCRTQSLPAFSKNTKEVCRPGKVKYKSRSISAKRDKKNKSKREGGSSNLSMCFNLICCFTLITVVGLIVLHFI